MKVTPEKKAAFCAALVASGGNVARACEAVDVTRMTAYRWRQDDKEFAQAWDEAKAIGLDARVKIKVAAQMYQFRFLAVRQKPKKAGGGWEQEVFE